VAVANSLNSYHRTHTLAEQEDQIGDTPGAPRLSCGRGIHSMPRSSSRRTKPGWRPSRMWWAPTRWRPRYAQGRTSSPTRPWPSDLGPEFDALLAAREGTAEASTQLPLAPAVPRAPTACTSE